MLRIKDEIQQSIIKQILTMVKENNIPSGE